MSERRERLRRVAGKAAPVVLVVGGAMTAVGFFALMTVGYPFVLAGVLVGVSALVLGYPERAAFGSFLTGAACGPAYLAWLNRGGPGTVCQVEHGGRTCVEAWSPWPFVIAAVPLAYVGMRLVRRSAADEPPSCPTIFAGDDRGRSAS